jgi:hypothetical protein
VSLERRTQAPLEGPQRQLIAAADQRSELVTADASHHVRGATGAPQRRRRRAQLLVTGEVPVVIIELFEPIEVDHHH